VKFETKPIRHKQRSPINSTTSSFRRGQKLELVYPERHKSCVGMATVVRYVKPLVWLHLDAARRFRLPRIFLANSTDLLPCGWSQLFALPLATSADLQHPFDCDAFVAEMRACRLTLTESHTCEWPPYAYIPYHFSPSDFISLYCLIHSSRLINMLRIYISVGFVNEKSAVQILLSVTFLQATTAPGARRSTSTSAATRARTCRACGWPKCRSRSAPGRWCSCKSACCATSCRPPTARATSLPSCSPTRWARWPPATRFARLSR